VECLEDRLTPVTFSAARVGGTLVVTQIHPVIGAIRIYDDPAGGFVSVADVDNGFVYDDFHIASRNLVVRLAPTDATRVTYDILSPRAGSVSLSLRNTAARTLDLTGGAEIGGNLTVTGGDGGLTVTESAALHVDGRATFRGGAGYDTLSLGAAGSSLGLLTALRFNAVGTSPGDTVARLVFRDPGGMFPDELTLDGTRVDGGLTYVGGAHSDTVVLGASPAWVGGDVRVTFGTQDELETSRFRLGQGGLIMGRVRVSGGRLGTDRVSLDGAVNGDVGLNLGGGTNTLSMFGDLRGPALRYAGGSGVDTIVYSGLASSAGVRFTARLGDGPDAVTFDTMATSPSSAFIDFGAGTDTFTGTMNPNYQFLHLP
jgi:hypothetical protein